MFVGVFVCVLVIILVAWEQRRDKLGATCQRRGTVAGERERCREKLIQLTVAYDEYTESVCARLTEVALPEHFY